MLKELKKQSIAKGMSSVFLFVFMAAVLIFLGFKDFQDVRKGPLAFEELKVSDLEEKACVALTLTENFGSYMEEYEQKIGSTYKKTTGVCYLIAMEDAATGENYLVSLAVPAEYEKKMEQMADNTFNEVASQAMEYTCEVKKMDSQDYNYASIYLQQMGFEVSEIKDILLPYHLVYREWESKTKYAYFLCGCGAVMALIGVILLIYTLSGARMGKIKKEIAKSGYSWELAEADYENAKVLMDKPTFRVGRVFTFFSQGATPHVILNKNIVWGHYYSVTEKGKAGLKKTTHMVGIRTIDKKGYYAEVPGEGRAQYILDMINAAMPWVVVGSDEAFENMFHRNFQGFLELRYNKIDDKTTNINE